VLARTGRLTALGLIGGLVGAWWSTGLVTSLLVQTSPRDPVIFVATAVALAVLGLVAAAGPASRAARVDPAQVLRAE
jgi:ABC-type antimicrobial peptide transport system permease subunit